MITFKQKALFSAIAGAGALALTGAANAVYVNHDGLGQVLVYPYYTARDGVATLLSVVNTTNNAKIVKVRFLEGKNSQEVLDFNLFLSPFDVWTGAVLPAGQAAADLLPGYTAPGPLGGGMLVTGDRSCTNPKIPAVGAAFRNFQYSADTTVAANQAMDRSMEGYVEMIEMAEIVSSSSLWADVKHTKANSWTPSCALVSHASVSANASAWLTGPRGGLFGAGTLLNASGGTNTGYDATALNDFWAANAASRYTEPGNILPSLNSATGLTSIVQNGSNVYITDWSASTSSLRGADAVSTVIMHSKVMNECAHTDDGVVGTDWVMTMPTKRFYVFPAPVRRPFQTAWNGRTARDDFGVSDTDREEFISTSVTNDDFSPGPTGTAADCTATASSQSSQPLVTVAASLCYEANVLGFGKIQSSAKSNVLSSANFFNLVNAAQNSGAAVPTVGKEGGWAAITFPTIVGSTTAHMLPAPSGATQLIDLAAPSAPTTLTEATYLGLPVIGFAIVQAKKTGSGADRYASSYNHKYQVSVQ